MNESITTSPATAKRKKQLFCKIGICGCLLCIALLIWFYISSHTPEIILSGSEAIEWNRRDPFVDPGATAFVQGKDISNQITTTGTVDSKTPGDYTITYQVTYQNWSASVTRTVTVIDTTPPVITVNGDNPISVASFEEYTEPGVTATDDCDGDLQKQVTATETSIDSYTKQIQYEVSDQSGNHTVATRKIVLVDVTAPVLSLNGSPEIHVNERDSYDDPGATATDDRDGDLTAKITRSGYVDIYRAGTYTLTYQVADTSGNTAEITRTVIIDSIYVNPEDAIYLTFDDGPSPDVTARILDILKANHIQATFFICNYSTANKPLIQRMIDEGHTIGIHGYSHEYGEIYQSTDAFMKNINKLKDKVKADTGYDAFVIRFPGGSSNAVSRKYCPGIMSSLVELVNSSGLMYMDWNISSGDAEGNNRPAATLIKNVTSGMKHGRNNVVLMHDTSAKRTTADALQEIINYGTANGFQFYPITQNTIPVHHKVNN